jgi:hypothetical protein
MPSKHPFHQASTEAQVISQASPYQIPLPPGHDEINHKLREEEFTCTPKNIPGLRSYDIVRVASNMPCEDSFTHAVMVDPVNTGSDWMAWGIFDGHVYAVWRDMPCLLIVVDVFLALGKCPPS